VSADEGKLEAVQYLLDQDVSIEATNDVGIFSTVDLLGCQFWSVEELLISLTMFLEWRLGTSCGSQQWRRPHHGSSRRAWCGRAREV
jgi:hypothetical protein